MGFEADSYDDMATAIRLFDRTAHTQRIENAVGDGTPDVTTCIKAVECWIEMKGMFKWRGKPSDKLVLPHELRDSQRKWLRNRWSAGGNCWVVLGIRQPKEWLIWTGPVAAAYLGFASRADLIEMTAVHASGKFPIGEFYRIIRARQLGDIG